MDEPASKSCPPPLAIVDCPDPYKASQRQRRIGVITAIGIFSIVLGVSLFAAFSSAVANYVPQFLIVIFLVLLLSRAYLGRKKFAYQQVEKTTPLTEDAIIALCTPDFWDSGLRMRALAKRLYDQGVVGRCVRICHVEKKFPAEPLTLPFEPIPLDQAEVGFANLMEQPGTQKENHSDGPKSPGEISSRMNRNVLLAGGRLTIAVFGFIWLMHAVEALMKWRVTWPLIWWSVFFALMLFGFGGRGAWTWRRQWLLVPGGVFTRTARFFQRNWQTHLFKRADSTLLLRNTHRSIWAACVFDGASLSRAGMTQTEAEMLLRAWLSPLPTPPLEQLSDLT